MNHFSKKYIKEWLKIPESKSIHAYYTIHKQIHGINFIDTMKNIKKERKNFELLEELRTSSNSNNNNNNNNNNNMDSTSNEKENEIKSDDEMDVVVWDYHDKCFYVISCADEYNKISYFL